MEITRDMIYIDGDFLLNDDQTMITAYIETWFDTEEKFGENLGDDDDTYLNLYANYNVETEELTCEYVISTTDSYTTKNYIPTANEAKLIKSMMEDVCQEIHGCSLGEFADPMSFTM